MDIMIVQLTDIHIKDDQDFYILSERINSLGGAICNHITEPENTAVIFCLTGDLAFSGQESQYIAVGILLEEIYSIINKRFAKVSIHSVFVPGNHDCDFENEAVTLREAILTSPKLDVADASQLELCTSIQKNYFNFVCEFGKKYSAMSCVPDKILTINELNLNDEKISIKFHCINTSWCSKKVEEKGKMKIVNGKMEMPANQLPDKNPNDIVITMMHHDAEWMDWTDKEAWNEYQKKFSDIVLVGHDHTTEFVLKQNYDESSNYYIKGNQLFDKFSPEQSGFNILKINTSHGSIQECFFTYEWKDGLYKRVIETEYHLFKRNRYLGSGIEIKGEVQKFLEEMDIDITCGDRTEIKLSDIFGFPTLKADRGNITKFVRDMPALIEYLDKNRFISIRGQKEYGKTALLKQLFEQFFKMKRFPVFLDISKINTSDGEALNRIVEERYKSTYNNIDINVIMQKCPDERVCLIDNFEEIKLSDKSAKRILQYLTGKFGYVAITRNHTLDILNPLNYVEMNDYIHENFSILVLQPTQKTSKDRIITKWLQLNSKYDENSVAFDGRKKEKYGQIHEVMKGNYFNKTPIDLLLVLSYLEQDSSNQLNYSRYSYVYEGLILNKLKALAEKQAGSLTNNISIYKTILQKIAYKMYCDEKCKDVDEEYIISVILDYKEHHSNTKLKVVDVMKCLTDFKFLEIRDDFYRFRHSYMYYYFVGSYIEDVLSPTEKERVIRNVFENINDDVNYNVALFLAYRLNIEHQIIPLVQEFGNPILKQFEDFKYDNIRKLIEEWDGNIEKKVEKIYNIPKNEEIPEIRKRAMEESEEQESDIETDTELSKIDEEVRQINSDVLKMARYIDFMGNILKNYSGKMANEPREKGIDFIFKSVSKIIGSLCNFSMYMVDKIIQMLEEKSRECDEETLKAKHEFTDLIKSSFAHILYTFIEDYLTGVAGSLECDILKENITSYCELHNSEFVKMARLEYLIRISLEKLPVDEIDKLFKGKDCLSQISKIIMKDNIYKYLSTFKYDVRDRQRVCSTLSFKSKDLFIQEQKSAMLSVK
ncbi:metallophosphoesterase [Clostridium sp. AF32-12BH]|uniref:metallophosphoesterase n=1 Tax=Clostridium sp. AF32-12BH TaxID=2292006 RepID=UPI000E4884EC|nr:metallophosphoesterase [Clostridium sp. AF32-12BH]RHP47297.1 hypothetical protein DWZ40_07675 [Clostridium sp. AF32-12BH]